MFPAYVDECLNRLNMLRRLEIKGVPSDDKKKCLGRFITDAGTVGHTKYFNKDLADERDHI